MSDAFIGFVGALIGSAITLVATLINNRMIEKREIRKKEMEREREAISQIFSPLVFILDKTRDLFVRIVALHNTFEKMSKARRNKEAVLILNYFAAKGSESYPQMLESLLIHGAGLIKCRQFYADLLVLQSYLSTTVGFLSHLILKSDKKPAQLKSYLTNFAPLLIQLDEGITQMRAYSLAKASGLHEPQYKHFFTEERFLELEGYVDEINKAMTGEHVLKWPLPIKRLIEDKNSKYTDTGK